jgi:ankyrin repeat protein
MPPKPKAFKKKQDQPSSSSPGESPSSPGFLSKTSSVLKQPLQDTVIDYLKSGNTEALRALILENAHDKSFLNRYHTKYGKHPLAVAAEEGRLEGTEILLEAKVEIDMRDNFDMTAFLYASKGGQNEILGLLIAAGADPNIEYQKLAENGLHLATARNEIETVKYLLERDLPFDKQNLRLETPLSIAIKYEYYDIAELFLSQGANINVRRTNGDSPLHSAVFDNRMETVVYILDHGGSVNQKNDIGETPLMIACKHGYVEIAKFLLQKGAELNAQDNVGRSSLFLASMLQKEALVSYLLDRFANVHLTDHFGSTALSVSCRLFPGNVNIISDLIRFKSHINSMDNSYNTPLHHTCSKHNRELTLLLLNAGASPSLKNIDGKLPLDFISNDEFREFYLESIDKMSKEKHTPVIIGNDGSRALPHWVATLKPAK